MRNLPEYIQAALRNARYAFLDEAEGYSGEIPEFSGVLATAGTLEECREELASTLEDWILFRVSKGLALPEIDGNSNLLEC